MLLQSIFPILALNTDCWPPLPHSASQFLHSERPLFTSSLDLCPWYLPATRFLCPFHSLPQFLCPTYLMYFPEYFPALSKALCPCHKVGKWPEFFLQKIPFIRTTKRQSWQTTAFGFSWNEVTITAF